MAHRRIKLRKNKLGLLKVRKVLDNGLWQRLTFDEKVFTALTWLGFTNSEAWGVINPQSDASANSKAVMAGRYSCNNGVKRYIELLNDLACECKLTYKGFNGYINPNNYNN